MSDERQQLGLQVFDVLRGDINTVGREFMKQNGIDVDSPRHTPDEVEHAIMRHILMGRVSLLIELDAALSEGRSARECLILGGVDPNQLEAGGFLKGGCLDIEAVLLAAFPPPPHLAVNWDRFLGS